MSLDSYNSTYPVEYYETGSCYSFYTAVDSNNRRTATNEEITKYSDVLEDCYSENHLIMTAGGSSYSKSICRAVGVVINKRPLDSQDYKNALDVMFMRADGSYYVTSFGIAGKKVLLNDKEIITPGKVVPGEYIPAVILSSASTVPTGRTAAKSGPTEVIKNGPTEVKKAGPTEVKKSGPTQVD